MHSYPLTASDLVGKTVGIKLGPEVAMRALSPSNALLERTQQEQKQMNHPQVPSTFIFLIGPPSVGKDTIADGLRELSVPVRPSERPMEYAVEKMAEPLKLACTIFTDGNTEPVGPDKNLAGSNFMRGGPSSWRQALISLSEEWAKPHFGQNIFGKLMVERLRLRHQFSSNDNPLNGRVSVCADAGFHAEAMPVLDFFGPENCLVVEMERNGTSFDGDSRSYWFRNLKGNSRPKVGGYMKLENNGSIQSAVLQVHAFVINHIASKV